MKYKSCAYIEQGMIFQPDALQPCCCDPKRNVTLFWKNPYNGELLDIDEYLRKRAELIEIFKSGKTPEQCENCFHIEERDWPETPQIRNITISNHTKCSCKCIYCMFTKDKEYHNNRKTYNIFPIFEQLTNAGLIKNATVGVAGGECCEYEPGELEGLLGLLQKSNSRAFLFSSGIIFSECIKDALSKRIADLNISVDSGTKKTYEKIKQVKAFDVVWKNIENYIGKTNSSQVHLKYILIPGINDNLKEIKAFVKKCNEVGCTSIWIDIEYNWWNENSKKPIPKHFYDIYKFLDKQKNIHVDYKCGQAYYIFKDMIEGRIPKKKWLFF